MFCVSMFNDVDLVFYRSNRIRGQTEVHVYGVPLYQHVYCIVYCPCTRSWSPRHGGQSSLSAAAPTGKSKKSSSKKSKSHHDASSSSSSSKKSKLKKQQANKQPVTAKAYTDMPIF